jgi:prophage tail gpP-like protein
VITIEPKLNLQKRVADAVAASKDDAALSRIRVDQMASQFALLGVDKHKFSLVIEGAEINEVTSASLTCSIDSAVDGFTAVVPFDTDWKERVELFRPFTYRRCEVYLGGSLQFSGRVYGHAPSMTRSGRYMTLSGWSLAADMLDSDAIPPYQSANVTLEKYARQLLESHGFEVVWNGGDDKKFPRVTADPGSKIMDHLIGLATQRGKLIVSDAYGRVCINAAGVPDSPRSVATIEEGFPPFQSVEANFDGRNRFGIYTILSSTQRRNGTVSAIDDRIPAIRHATFTADEADDSDMKRAAYREASRASVEALTMQFATTGWYSDAEEKSLWKPNSMVHVVSPTAYIPDGIDLLVRSVEYIFETTGCRSTLGLVPKEAYTGEALEVF